MAKVLILNLLLFTSLAVLSQSLTPEILSSSGDYYTNQNVSLSWTLGEVTIQTYKAETIILTQGFHQPDIDTVNVVENILDGYQIKVYPNPINQMVMVEFLQKKPERIIIEIFDLNGRLLSQERIEIFEEAVEVEFSRYVSGKYFLRIRTTDNNLNVTYPIIKLN